MTALCSTYKVINKLIVAKSIEDFAEKLVSMVKDLNTADSNLFVQAVFSGYYLACGRNNTEQQIIDQYHDRVKYGQKI